MHLPAKYQFLMKEIEPTNLDTTIVQRIDAALYQLYETGNGFRHALAQMVQYAKELIGRTDAKHELTRHAYGDWTLEIEEIKVRFTWRFNGTPSKALNERGED